jgi:hypothetical protein
VGNSVVEDDDEQHRQRAASWIIGDSTDTRPGMGQCWAKWVDWPGCAGEREKGRLARVILGKGRGSAEVGYKNKISFEISESFSYLQTDLNLNQI